MISLKDSSNWMNLCLHDNDTMLIFYFETVVISE